VRVIYWCRGALDIRAVVKGRRPAAGKEFLWGIAKPDCTEYVSDDSHAISRVWFIREEEKFLRPVVDGFGIYYVNFYVPWATDPRREPQQQFGELLLSPAARAASLADFAQGFDAHASTACFLLGRERCIERIRSLSRLGDPDLHRAACDFLNSEMEVACEE
jgi:hypothetical protein